MEHSPEFTTMMSAPDWAMRQWAVDHADRSHGTIEPLSPEEMPSVHDLRARIEGNPINDHQQLREAAEKFDPTTSELIRLSQRDWSITEKSLEVLLDGNNLLLSANHYEAVDQAKIMLAVKSNIMELMDDIRRSGPYADQGLPHISSAIVMSHLMSFLKFTGGTGEVPMTEPPKTVADQLLMTMPDSKSVAKFFSAPSSQAWVKGRRTPMLKALLDVLRQDEATLWSMSAGGATDETRPDGLVVVGGVEDPTARLAQGRTYILQMGFATIDGVVHFDYVADPQPITDPKQMHELMHGSTRVLNKSLERSGQSDDVWFEYEEPLAA